LDALRSLQLRVAERADQTIDPAGIDRLSVTSANDGLHVDLFGDPFGECYEELLATLVRPEVSSGLISLCLRGPDVGSNGTRNWDLSQLADGDICFPRLRSLVIEQASPADHNQSIVASVYEEEGVLARLLSKAPSLEHLVSPSAPGADFFEVGRRPLRFLSVDAGYDHQGFIRNLARSHCFPDLVSLEYGEYSETYTEDFESHVTPIGDYDELFDSPSFARVMVFVWRNPACDASEIARLKGKDQRRAIQVVRWSAEWVR
jgi:hypothetical protein